MSGTPKAKISLRDIRVLQPGQTIWDGSVSGLAARRQVSPVVSYILMYRTMDGRKRTYTIGKHGSPWTPETARQEARRILREVVKGADPMADKLAERGAITVAELCQQYMADVEAGRLLTRRKAAKTESTLISDRGRIARHIIPLLGRKSVASVTTGRYRCASCTTSPPARQHPGKRPSHAVCRSFVVGVVSPVAALGCSVPSSPMPFARAFGSTTRRMASSGSPMDDGNDG